jgi:tight adherence protein B
MQAMPQDTLTLAAPAVGGLAVLVLATAVMPAFLARRAAASRLETFVLRSTPTRAGTAERPRALERRRVIRVRLATPGWLVGRELPALLLVGGSASVYGLTRDPVLAIAAALETLLFASLWGDNLVAARARQLDAQTLPTLLRLSSVLRSGGSLLQAMEAVAEDGQQPTRDEFAHTLRDVALGAALDDALDKLAKRAGTADYALLSLVLNVQRRLGGNLPQVLDKVAETVQDRLIFRQELATLTAQQRLATWVLVLLPFGVLGLFSLLDRSFVAPLFTTVPGHIVLLAGATLQLIGGWALRWAGKISA